MVCLDRLRENGLLFERKNISLSCIRTRRDSRFDFSFNGLTYMLCAPQISLELTGGNRDGHWGNLQFVLWRIPLRGGREMGEKYTSEKEKKKKLARTRTAMEKYWYFMHGNATVHLKNADAEKTKFERKVQEVTWNRWNAERGERALLWDKWAVFL